MMVKLLELSVVTAVVGAAARAADLFAPSFHSPELNGRSGDGGCWPPCIFPCIPLAAGVAADWNCAPEPQPQVRRAAPAAAARVRSRA